MSALENYPLSSFRFLTVTTSPESPQSQDVEGLRLAWKEFVRRMRRKYGVFEYIAVVEQNKKENLLHIHALIRSPYIPQEVLSIEWRKITKAYVVFITALYLVVDGKRLTGRELDELNEEQKMEVKTKVAAYITKYITKSNKKLQNRVWVSRKWSERWNYEKRMYRVGMDLDRRVGTEKIWWNAYKEMVKRSLKFIVNIERYFQVSDGGEIVASIFDKRLVVGRDAFNKIDFSKYVWVELYEHNKIVGKLMRADKLFVGNNLENEKWYMDDKFWMDLVEYLETNPINAPPDILPV